MSDDAPTTDDGDDAGSMGSLLGALASTRRSPALAQGAVVGEQYEIVKPIGQGGMGVVYLARDRKLDRDVAIKVGYAMSPEALAFVEREARTLAKLAHPNVVVVHQVGEVDGRIFIAMEYIPITARAWLASEQRSWRDVVGLYAAVGEGLAAAHAAGLVHRDFKPENVLVGTDRRPRISDFGLARASSEIEAGHVVGTPGYMPPEQVAGDAVDAQADQYAFAVAVWEALFDERPTADPDVPSANPRGAPRAVIASLRRALATSASARWPDLASLVSALRASLDRRRNRWLAASAATLVVGAAGAFAAVQLVRDTPSCDTGETEIAAVWSPVRRAGFLFDDALVRFVDSRAKTWAITADAACKATRIDHTATAEVLDRRTLCLARAKTELDAALQMASRSREAAAQVLPFLETRTAPESCLAGGLGDEERPPPGARAQLDKALDDVAQAEAAALDRGISDPLGRTERAVASARALGWRPLLAEALVGRGNVLLELGRPAEASKVLEEAAQLAIASRADDTAVKAYLRGATAMSAQERTAEADQLMTTARALWERIGKPPSLGWQLYSATTQLAYDQGHTKDAFAAVQMQISLGQVAFHSSSALATDYHDFAAMLLETGDLVRAAEVNGKAIQLYSESLGTDHPTVGKARVQAAYIAIRAGKPAEAVTQASAGLALIEDWYGPEDVRLVQPLTTLGDAYRWVGKLDLARTHLERALAIARRATPKDRTIELIEQNLAILAFSRGDLVEARTRGEAALAAAEQRLGPDHLALIDFLAVVAAVAREGATPDLAASDRMLARAQTIARAQLPDGHRRVVNLAIERSYTQVKANQARAAIEALSPYVARIESLSLGALTPSELRFALAQAHAAVNERPRACALAKEAHAGYLEAKAREAAGVEAWLAKQCR